MNDDVNNDVNNDKRVTRVAPGVLRLQLRWSCAYVLHDTREFWLVDTGTRHDRRLLRDLLWRAGLRAPCECVLLTHAHLDHAGNAAHFARRGARVLLHPDETPFFQGRPHASLKPRAWNAQRVAFGIGGVAAPVERCKASPDLRDNRELFTPAGTWRVLHTPGHVALYRESDGVLLAGDALLNVRAWSRREEITLPMPIYSSDTRQALRSAIKLVALAANILAPGHGPTLFDAGPKLRAWASHAFQIR